METCKIHEHRTDLDPCKNPSAYRWQWSWGQRGEVCPDHLALVRQLADQLGQPLLLESNAAPPPPAPSSDELEQKVRDVAGKLESAELELVQERATAETLRNRNAELNGRLRTSEAQVEELGKQLTRALEAENSALQEVSELKDRLARVSTS